MHGAKMKIVPTGATGQVGRASIPHLPAESSVEVVAGVRDLKKASTVGVASVYPDLDNSASMVPALRGIIANAGAFRY